MKISSFSNKKGISMHGVLDEIFSKLERYFCSILRSPAHKPVLMSKSRIRRKWHLSRNRREFSVVTLEFLVSERSHIKYAKAQTKNQ